MSTWKHFQIPAGLQGAIACALLAAVSGRVEAQSQQPIVDTEYAAKNAVQVSFIGTVPDLSRTGDAVAYTVPANKRLVIEHVTLHVTVPVNLHATAFVETQLGGAATHWLVLASHGSFEDGSQLRLTSSQPTRIYANPGTNVRVVVEKNVASTNTASSFNGTISGYLIDL